MLIKRDIHNINYVYPKRETRKKSKVVQKVSVRQTLLSIAIGEEREFSCVDFPLARARVVASQLKSTKKRVFKISSDALGTSFTVRRTS